MFKKEPSELLKAFNAAVDAYTTTLCSKWGIDPHYAFWAGDDRSGVFCIEDGVNLNLCEVILCVEYNYDYCSVCEWQEYNIKAHHFNFNYIKLEAWFMGAPRVPEGTFKRLEKMEKEVVDLAVSEKERVAKETEKYEKEKGEKQ